jgi:Kdo2-lipid IVA lauroyltransferase/acyltransferase
MPIAVLRLLARLPLRLLHATGATLGWLVYWLSPTYAARMRDNLHLSGIQDSGRLLPRAVAEVGKGMSEILKIWFGPDAEVAALARCDDWATVDSARAKGKGIIFLTPHIGCFEIAALYIVQRLPITVLYRPPKLRWIEPLMIAGRARGGAALAPANFKGVRLLYRALQRGESVGLLPDQTPGGGEGVWANFFGRPAYTMTLLRRLQQTTSATMIMVLAERLPHARGYQLHFSEISGQGFNETELNAAVEAVIRKCPAQYLWGYNRYKVPAGAEPPPS